jgi:hypothetical protein
MEPHAVQGKGIPAFRDLLVLASTPIIFSTGSPESVSSLAKNFNLVILKKPVNPELLIDTTRKLLNTPKAPDQQPTT